MLFFDYLKISKISSGAYFWRDFGVRTEICVSKSIGLACSGKEIYNFCFVLLCIRGQIPDISQLGAYIRRGDLTEVFWVAYVWRGLFSEFYGK